MILSKLEEFSDSQGPITASAISHVIDLMANPTLKDPGSEPPYLVVQVDVTGTGTGTLTIELVSDSTANLATAPVSHLSSPAIVGTDLVAKDTILQSRIPLVGVPSAARVTAANYKRYLGLKYTISGTVGAVKLSAFLSREPVAAAVYPTVLVAS